MTSPIPQHGRARPRIARIAVVACALIVPASAEDAPPLAPRVERLERPGGAGQAAGRLVAEAGPDFRFRPDGGGPSLVLNPGDAIRFEGPSAKAPGSAAPTFGVDLGLGQRISGRLAGVDAATIRLVDGPGGRPLAVPRSAALALFQRSGEAQVLRDGFEAIDPARWLRGGLPELAREPHLEGSNSLQLPAGGASLTGKLAESVAAGRLDVAFYDDGQLADGQSWFVDLTFRTLTGPASLRAVLGWAEESLAVQSTPGGPALAVQRLARKVGWRRLVVGFGPDRTELAVDGDELARGQGPGGPLVEIRLATTAEGTAEAPDGLAAHLDDLRLARLADMPDDLEVDPSQDEARLVIGDQLFGRLANADPDGLVFQVEGRDTPLAWSEVAAVAFERRPEQARPVSGLLARVEWLPGNGSDPRDVDAVEGAIAALDDATLTLATPSAGDLAIPRDRLVRLSVLGRGRRIVIDPTPHHLGDNVSAKPPRLDPPRPEGGVLERSFKLEATLVGPAELVLDVVQVIGLTGNPDFSKDVRDGFLRTKVLINGREFDFLNRPIADRNETPARIRLPIPAGLLVAGANRLRFEQVGIATDPNNLDELGVLGIALEFPDARPPATP